MREDIQKRFCHFVQALDEKIDIIPICEFSQMTVLFASTLFFGLIKKKRKKIQRDNYRALSVLVCLLRLLRTD